MISGGAQVTVQSKNKSYVLILKTEMDVHLKKRD